MTVTARQHMHICMCWLCSLKVLIEYTYQDIPINCFLIFLILIRLIQLKMHIVCFADIDDSFLATCQNKILFDMHK